MPWEEFKTNSFKLIVPSLGTISLKLLVQGLARVEVNLCEDGEMLVY